MRDIKVTKLRILDIKSDSDSDQYLIEKALAEVEKTPLVLIHGERTTVDLRPARLRFTPDGMTELSRAMRLLSEQSHPKTLYSLSRSTTRSTVRGLDSRRVISELQRILEATSNTRRVGKKSLKATGEAALTSTLPRLTPPLRKWPVAYVSSQQQYDKERRNAAAEHRPFFVVWEQRHLVKVDLETAEWRLKEEGIEQIDHAFSVENDRFRYRKSRLQMGLRGATIVKMPVDWAISTLMSVVSNPQFVESWLDYYKRIGDAEAVLWIESRTNALDEQGRPIPTIYRY